MKVVCHPEQKLHYPEKFLVNGVFQPNPEVPERYDRLLEAAGGEVQGGHYYFFLGRIEGRGDPGLAFYPVVVALRTTPELLALAAAAGLWILGRQAMFPGVVEEGGAVIHAKYQSGQGVGSRRPDGLPQVRTEAPALCGEQFDVGVCQLEQGIGGTIGGVLAPPAGLTPEQRRILCRCLFKVLNPDDDVINSDPWRELTSGPRSGPAKWPLPVPQA